MTIDEMGDDDDNNGKEGAGPEFEDIDMLEMCL